MTDTASPVVAPADAPRPRRRWPRVLLVALILIVVLVAVAPALLAPWVAAKLVAEASTQLDGQAALEDLSFGWGGGVHLSGFSFEDRAGQPVLSLSSLDADVDLLGALGGRYSLLVHADGLRVDVRRDADGELNVEKLPRAAEPPSVPEGAPGGGAPPEPLPDVHMDLQLTDARIVLHDGARTTTLDDVRCSLKLDGLDRPAPFELSARVTGPEGPGGALDLRGEVTVAEGGVATADGLRAHLVLQVQDILLAALQPAAAVLAGVEELSGTLAGGGEWTLTGPLQLEGRTELRLLGLRAAGGPLSSPLVVPDTQLLVEAATDAEGTGRQRLEVTAGDALTLTWTGKAERLASADGSLAGQLALDAQIGPALAAAADVLPLQPGLAVDGHLTLRSSPELRLRDGELAGLDADLNVGLADVAARDAQGQAIDLGELTKLDLFLKAGLDAGSGALRLERFVLEAGPVQAHASAAVAGLPLSGGAFDASRLTVSDGSLVAEADLARLTTLLGRVVDLGGRSAEGSLFVSTTVSGGGQRLASESTVRVAGLRVGGAGLDALHPLELNLTQRGTLDLSPGGESRLEELALVANALELRATGRVSDVLDPDRCKGRLEPRLTLHTTSIAATLAPLLDGLVFTGHDVDLQGVVDIDGQALAVAADVHAPLLGASGGALGTEPLQISELKVSLEAQVPAAAQALSVPRLEVSMGEGLGAGGPLPALALKAAGLSFDSAAGTLDVAEVHLQSAPATGGGSLHLSGLTAAAPAVRADLAFEGSLPAVVAAAAPFAPQLEGTQASGTWALKLAASGDATRSTLKPELRLAGASLTGLAAGGQELVQDQDLTLSADVELRNHAATTGTAAGTLDVTLARLDLASPLLNGTASGRLAGLGGDAARAEALKGEFRYVPDRVAALLGPLLPGKLSGAAEERLEFSADGPLAGGELRDQLAGLSLKASVGTGTLELPGLTLGGTTRVESGGGSLVVGGDLQANGGTLHLDSRLDLRREAAGGPAPRSEVKLSLQKVRANGELGQVLAAFNPLFASAGGQVGDIDANIDAGVTLAWDGELPLEALLAGTSLATLPLQPLSGTADLSLGQVTLAGSPLLGELLSLLGRGATQSLDVDKLAVALEKGRLRYTEPFDVRLAGVDTNFAGSVGLDGTLDLTWNVPVTAELVAKHGFLEKLAGQPMAIPLEGSVAAPKLRWSDALGDLAKAAAKQELEDGLKGKLGGLGGLVGGQPKGGDAPAPGGAASDPEQILKQADDLWAAEKKDEARPLYKRLKDDFKLTLTYQLNKDRIDDRAKAPKKKKD